MNNLIDYIMESMICNLIFGTLWFMVTAVVAKTDNGAIMMLLIGWFVISTLVNLLTLWQYKEDKDWIEYKKYYMKGAR